MRPHVCRQPVSIRAPVQHRLRKAPVASAQSGVGLSTDLKEYLDGLVHKDKIVAFIKGTKQFPQCGFSNTVVQVTYGAHACNVDALQQSTAWGMPAAIDRYICPRALLANRSCAHATCRLRRSTCWRMTACAPA